MRKRNVRFLGVSAVVLLAASAVAFGCGDDDSSSGSTAKDGGGGGTDTGTTNNDTGAATTGSLTGTVTYTGNATGPAFYMALFPSFPPPGPPTYSAHVANPTFPATYTIPAIKPGTYYVSAYLSTGSDHPTGPIPADPENFATVTTPVTIAAGPATNLPVTLNDPPPTDGGTDEAGDAADDGG